MSLASRSHRPRFVKLEGPACLRGKIIWVPLTHSWSGGGSQGWRFLTLFQYRHILSAGIFPTSKLSLSFLALLLLVPTTVSPDRRLFPSSLWNFLCIFVFTDLLHPVSSFHPVYLTPTTRTSCNREINVSFSIVS